MTDLFVVTECLGVAFAEAVLCGIFQIQYSCVRKKATRWPSKFSLCLVFFSQFQWLEVRVCNLDNPNSLRNSCCNSVILTTVKKRYP